MVWLTATTITTRHPIATEDAEKTVATLMECMRPLCIQREKRRKRMKEMKRKLRNEGKPRRSTDVPSLTTNSGDETARICCFGVNQVTRSLEAKDKQVLSAVIILLETENTHLAHVPLLCAARNVPCLVIATKHAELQRQLRRLMRQPTLSCLGIFKQSQSGERSPVEMALDAIWNSVVAADPAVKLELPSYSYQHATIKT